jgi:hypothetical protein
MEPEIECIHYLINHTFIRNLPYERFLEKHNLVLNLENFICYTTGSAAGKRIVHAFRFLSQSSNSKIKSYRIQWWNTASFETIDHHSVLQSICFWVHSGMTLRKNFFLFDDRLSLFRSTFIYDRINGFYHRLSALNSFTLIPEISNCNQQIFTAPGKYYFHQRVPRLISTSSVNPLQEEIRKQLSKLTCRKNVSIYLRKSFPQLYHEIHNFIK